MGYGGCLFSTTDWQVTWVAISSRDFHEGSVSFLSWARIPGNGAWDRNKCITASPNQVREVKVVTLPNSLVSGKLLAAGQWCSPYNYFTLCTAWLLGWVLVRGGHNELARCGVRRNPQGLPSCSSPRLPSDMSHSLPCLLAGGFSSTRLLGTDSGSALLTISLASAELREDEHLTPQTSYRVGQRSSSTVVSHVNSFASKCPLSLLSSSAFISFPFLKAQFKCLWEPLAASQTEVPPILKLCHLTFLPNLFTRLAEHL